ncbi:hypothetical protein [Prosthecobacter sp.]|uniref:hypothetical protein n=1 Tax=Prosthecobacter sp. TaxID=1965333 RepID=UPI003783FAB5
MRWCLYIPSILIMLALGAELCAMYDAGMVKDPARLVCILDDDDTELKESVLKKHSLPDSVPFTFADMQLMIRWVQAETVSPRRGAGALESPPGMRRHRWLCRECC